MATTRYSLVVTDNKGAESDRSYVTIEVKGVQNHAPEAVISASTNTVVLPGTSVILSAVNSTDADGDELYYLWSTGENTQSITVAPTSTTEYELTVSDSNGASSTVQYTVQVKADFFDNKAPVAKVNPTNTNVVVNKSFTLSAASSTDDEGIVSYKWFVDNSFVASGSATYTSSFAAQGEHTISVVVADKEGLSSTATAKVTVVAEATADAMPRAVISMSSGYLAKSGDRIVFSGRNSSDDLGITQYQWYIDGQLQQADTSSFLGYTFVASGMHEVLLQVTDTIGQTATDVVSIFVSESKAPAKKPFIEYSHKGENLHTELNDAYGNENYNIKVFQKTEVDFVLNNVAEIRNIEVLRKNSDNSYTNCTVNNGNVSCGIQSASVGEQAVDSSSFNLIFNEIANYEVRIQTVTASGDNYAAFITVAAEEETYNENGIASSGGAVNPLLFLGLAAFFIRRKKQVKK